MTHSPVGLALKMGKEGVMPMGLSVHQNQRLGSYNYERICSRNIHRSFYGGFLAHPLNVG